MAQITLNMKLNSESFTVNDEDIIYMVPLVVSGAVVGSTITAIDTASADTQVLDVEETNAEVIALTDKLVQITLDDRSTPYIAISRIKDLITVNSLAVIKYDGNGNVFQSINTSMTVAQILSAIQTEQNEPKNYTASLNQSGTTVPTVVVLNNKLGVVPTWSYFAVGRYRLTSTGLFLANKVAVTLGHTDSTSTLSWYRVDDDTLEFDTANLSGTFANDFMFDSTVSIDIYP